MIRKIALSCTLALLIALPATASAQTINEEQYKAYLLNIIALLQQQVTLLIEAQTAPVVENDLEAEFSSFLIEDKDDVEARYFIDTPGQVAGIQDRTHRTYFDRFFTVVPDQYDRYFTEVIVYEERGNEFDGFVETVAPFRLDTWRFGLNESMFEFPVNSRLVTELFVHEFAHILSYEDVDDLSASRDDRCHEYYDGFDCPPDNSYFKIFADEYWTDDILDDFVEEGEDLWSGRELENDFVTDYAATAPGEDFAESFTDFVLRDRPTGSDLKDEKVLFFYQYEDLWNLREIIRSQI